MNRKGLAFASCAGATSQIVRWPHNGRGPKMLAPSCLQHSLHHPRYMSRATLYSFALLPASSESAHNLAKSAFFFCMLAAAAAGRSYVE